MKLKSKKLRFRGKLKSIKLKFLTLIDFKYFRTKIEIWIFSALISIAPIIYMGVKELLKKGDSILNSTVISNSVLCSTDLVYSLVTLSTIVVSDVLCSAFIERKESKGLTYFYCLIHILTIIFGVLLYTLYKTEDFKIDDIIAMNKYSLIYIVLLSLLSYIHISSIEKVEEQND